MQNQETSAASTDEVRAELQERIDTLGKDYGRYRGEAANARLDLQKAEKKMEQTRELLYQYGTTMDVLSDVSEIGNYSDTTRVHLIDLDQKPFRRGETLRVLYVSTGRHGVEYYTLSRDMRLPRFTHWRAAESFIDDVDTAQLENPAIGPS